MSGRGCAVACNLIHAHIHAVGLTQAFREYSVYTTTLFDFSGDSINYITASRIRKYHPWPPARPGRGYRLAAGLQRRGREAMVIKYAVPDKNASEEFEMNHYFRGVPQREGEGARITSHRPYTRSIALGPRPNMLVLGQGWKKSKSKTEL